MKKSLAVWASLWLIFNWVLGCIFAAPLRLVYDQVFYFGASKLRIVSVDLTNVAHPGGSTSKSAHLVCFFIL